LPAAPVFAGVRVLVADDNIVNQKVAVKVLEQMSATAVCVGNGRAALEALREADFDVVLMDCQMPEMDGYEATRQLRRSPGIYRNSAIPVIALTAHVMSDDRAGIAKRHCKGARPLVEPGGAVSAVSANDAVGAGRAVGAGGAGGGGHSASV
jgi:CheY-like chemotaxis protein